MKRPITALLILALASCNVPAFAEDVTVEETPASIETMHETAASIADILQMDRTEEPADLAMIYHVPSDATAEVMARKGATLPLTINAGTGSDTRLSFDMTGAKAQVEENGWGWKTWTVIGVSIVAVAAASVMIVQATQSHSHSSHSEDSSTTINVPGNGNTIHVNSPATTTSSTHNNSTTSTTWRGEE